MTGTTASVNTKEITAKTSGKRTGATSKRKNAVTKKTAATEEGTSDWSLMYIIKLK